MDDMPPLAEERFNEVVRGAIARARESKGLTQAQVADALNAGGSDIDGCSTVWTRDRVARLENGRVRPLLVDVVHLCIVLDLDLADILKGTPEGRFVRAQAAKRAAALFATYAELEGGEDPLVVLNPDLEAVIDRLSPLARPPEVDE